MINGQINYLKKYNKKIKVINKKDSFLMKFISFILFFNNLFIKNQTTTINNTIYLPNDFDKFKDIFQKQVIAHEYIHIYDSNNDPLFNLKYLFPQILAPLSFLLFFINWWLPIIFFVLFMLPWPACFRKKYELRGYTMTLLDMHLNYGDMIKDDDWDRVIDITNSYFTGPMYYFMWPFGVKKELKKIEKMIRNGTIYERDFVYRIAANSLSAE